MTKSKSKNSQVPWIQQSSYLFCLTHYIDIIIVSTMIITKVMYIIKNIIICFLKITGFVHQDTATPICLSLRFKGIRY